MNYIRKAVGVCINPDRGVGLPALISSHLRGLTPYTITRLKVLRSSLKGELGLT